MIALQHLANDKTGEQDTQTGMQGRMTMTDLAEKLQSERTVPASVSRFDRAWGVVIGAGLLMFVNLGPVLYYTSGIPGDSALQSSSTIGPKPCQRTPSN